VPRRRVYGKRINERESLASKEFPTFLLSFPVFLSIVRVFCIVYYRRSGLQFRHGYFTEVDVQVLWRGILVVGWLVEVDPFGTFFLGIEDNVLVKVIFKA